MLKNLKKTVICFFLIAVLAVAAVFLAGTTDSAQGLSTSAYFSAGSGVSITGESEAPSNAPYYWRNHKGVRIYGASSSYAVYNKVIDLKKLDSTKKIFEAVPVGTTVASSITAFKISLVDVCDADNTLSFRWGRLADNASYLRAEYTAENGNEYKGGLLNGSHYEYGPTVYQSFNCTATFPSESGYSFEPFNLSLDYEDMAVYTDYYYQNWAHSKIKVIDLDDEEVLSGGRTFGGFTTGEVYLKIEFATSTDGGLHVFKIEGESLAEESETFSNPDVIRFGNDSEITISDIKIGQPIEFPVANASDAVFGYVDVTRKIYIVTTEGLEEVPIRENTIDTTRLGKYKLIYSAIDNIGRQVSKEYNFEIYNSAYGLVNKPFSIPSFDGTVKVYDGENSEIVIINGTFTASYSGDYEVVYTTLPTLTVHILSEKPALSAVFSHQLSDEYVNGDLINIPTVEINSSICDYSEYGAEIYVNANLIDTVSVEEFNGYCVGASGEYTIKYFVNDVFGDKVYLDKSYFFNVKKEVNLLLNQPIKTSYFINDVINLTGGYIFYDGVRYDIQVETTDPSGNLKTVSDRIVFDRIGSWELRFYSNALAVTETVNVIMSSSMAFNSSPTLGSIQGGCSVPSYAPPLAQGREGTQILGPSNSYAVYSKIINLNYVDPTEPFFEAVAVGENISSITSFRVTLIDVTDASNRVSVLWKTIGGAYAFSHCLIEYDNYAIARNNDVAGNELREVYGTTVKQSFSPSHTSESLPFNFRFDYANKAFYSNINSVNHNYLLLDLDDTQLLGSKYNPWKGFATGEVYVRIEIVSSTSGGLNVLSLAGNSLAEKDFVPFENRGIIRFGDQTHLTFINGVVGYNYNLPHANKTDVVFGLLDIDRKLFYIEKNETEVLADGDYFIPDQAGRYRIEYSVLDNIGNPVVKSYEFLVQAEPDPIEIELPTQRSVKINSEFVFPVVKTTGGAGKHNVTTFVNYNGKFRYPDENGKLFVGESGMLIVGIVVCDEIGYMTTASYKITIDTDVREIVTYGSISAAFEGDEITFAFDAFDYSVVEGEPGRIMNKYVTVDGERIEGFTYTVPAGKESISVVYCGEYGTKSVCLENQIEVIPQEIDSILDYIIYDGKQVADTVLFNAGVVFELKPSDSTYISMPFPMIAYGLNIKFTLHDDSRNFKSVNVYLRDSVNPSQSIKLEFYGFSDSFATLRIGDNEYSFKHFVDEYGLTSDLSGRPYRILELNLNNSLELSNYLFQKICDVPVYENGNIFRGFDSGKIFLSFQVTEIDSNSDFVINKIGNEDFNRYSDKYDIKPPMVSFDRKFYGINFYYYKGEEFEMPKAYVADVLNAFVAASVTVESPDKRIIYQSDDLLSGDIILLDTIGSYTLKYKVCDGAYNSETYSYRIHVRSKDKPVITVNEKMPVSVKRGHSFTVPDFEVTVSDASVSYKKYAFIREGDNGDRIVSTGEEYACMYVGDCYLTFYAEDDFGNVSTVKYLIRVVE